MARVIGVTGSGTAQGTQCRMLREDDVVVGSGTACGFGDEASVIDGATDSGRGRWRRVRASTVVGNDGAEAPGRTR
jgi:hypothetical protein